MKYLKNGVKTEVFRKSRGYLSDVRGKEVGSSVLPIVGGDRIE